MKGLAQTSVTELKGVGAKAAEKLEKLAIVSVQDLLFHLPHRYEDRTRIYPMSDLQPHLHTSIQGEVMSCDIQFGRKRMLVVRLSDGSGTVTLRMAWRLCTQSINRLILITPLPCKNR
jgi:ATP-dependent DNA helicase RecG